MPRFTSFVVFAEMRTGSNLLEANLNALPGVTAVVDLAAKTAVVTGDAGDEALKKAVADAGYQVTDIR